MQQEEEEPYRYYDTPDGQDLMKKLQAWLFPTSIGGFGLGTIDVVLYSQPKTTKGFLRRYAFITLPFIGLNVNFVLVSNLAARFRNKDDHLNWTLAGATTGSWFGLWFRRPMIGFNMAMFLGIVCTVIKDVHMQGWRLIPPDDRPIPESGVHLNDWTLTAHRPGNWTTGK